MSEWAGVLIQGACALVSVGAIVVTLRVEMRHVWKSIERIEKDVTAAHQRIDNLQDKRA